MDRSHSASSVSPAFEPLEARLLLTGSITGGGGLATGSLPTIIGVGASRRLSAVRWGVARNVVWAWVLTIPCTGLIAAAIYFLVAAV